MSENNKLKKVKHNFDRVTSQNSTNWKLVLFWILFFEVVASLIEFIYVDKSAQYSVHITHTLTTELILASMVALFVWFCIYNIIFESKRNIFRLAILSVIGAYLIITSDLTLQFLLHNLNPFHFFDYEFGVVFFVELFFKLILAYLIYQLIVSIRNRNAQEN